MRNLILALATICFFVSHASAQFNANPISRAQMIANAESYDNGHYTWTGYTANINAPWLGGFCGGRNVYCAKSPYYGCVIVGQNWGMPYCWGGWSTFAQHATAMSTGKSAGDVCSYPGGGCSAQGPYGAGLNCTSGMDCSGFVGRAWNWPGSSKPGTSTLADQCTPIKGQFVRKGDIYDKIGDHVRMAINENPPTANGMAQTIEESLGTNRRVEKRYTYQLNNYEMSGYPAYVYNNRPSCGSAPSGLVYTKTSTSITINWSNSNGSTGEVYYRKSTESSYSLKLGVSSWPYTLTGLTPNSTYYIKISKTCSDGSWGISPSTLMVTTNSLVGNEDRSEKQQVELSCNVLVNDRQISAVFFPESNYVLANTVGQIISQGKSTDGSINCSVTASGTYFLAIADNEGNRCVQKIFVRR